MDKLPRRAGRQLANSTLANSSGNGGRRGLRSFHPSHGAGAREICSPGDVFHGGDNTMVAFTGRVTYADHGVASRLKERKQSQKELIDEGT